MRRFSYDEKNDILLIHKGFEKSEKFKGNIDLGNLILDISNKKRIRGIEVMNASRFFKEFVHGEKLKKIIDADFNAIVKHQSIIIGINFKTKEKEGIPIKIAVPLLR